MATAKSKKKTKATKSSSSRDKSGRFLKKTTEDGAASESPPADMQDLTADLTEDNPEIKRKSKLERLPPQVWRRIYHFLLPSKTIKLYPVLSKDEVNDLYWDNPGLKVGSLRPQGIPLEEYYDSEDDHTGSDHQYVFHDYPDPLSKLPGLMFTTRLVNQQSMNALVDGARIEAAILRVHSEYPLRHKHNFHVLQEEIELEPSEHVELEADKRELTFGLALPRQSHSIKKLRILVPLIAPLGNDYLPSRKELWNATKGRLRKDADSIAREFRTSLELLTKIQPPPKTINLRIGTEGYQYWGLLHCQAENPVACDMRRILIRKIDGFTRISLPGTKVVVSAHTPCKDFVRSIRQLFQTGRPSEINMPDAETATSDQTLETFPGKLPLELVYAVISHVVGAPFVDEGAGFSDISTDVYEWKENPSQNMPLPSLMDVNHFFRAETLFEIFKQQRLRLEIIPATSFMQVTDHSLREVAQWVHYGRSAFVYLPRHLSLAVRAKITQIRLVIPIRAEHEVTHEGHIYPRPRDLRCDADSIKWSQQDLECSLQCLWQLYHHGFTNIKTYHVHLKLDSKRFYWGIENNTPPSMTLPVALNNIVELSVAIRDSQKRADIWRSLPVDTIKFYGESRVEQIISVLNDVIMTRSRERNMTPDDRIAKQAACG